MEKIKDKIVTVESLSILHEDNKNTYMRKDNPIGNGTMTMDGDANFSGNVDVGSIMIGSKIKLVPTDNALQIMFLEEEAIDV